MATVPTFDEFIDPLLRVLATGTEPLPTTDAYEKVANRLGLSAEQRAEMLPSDRQAYYKNRIGWAHDRLKRAGLSTSPRRGYWQLTEAGHAFAAQHASGIPASVVAQMAFRPRRDKLVGEDDGDALDSETAADDSRTPEERLQAAHEEIAARVRSDLLEQIHQSSPTFFERVVLDVLHAMGYGARRDDLTQTGGSGDGGIDGVVSLDRLGFEKVYVQAKRYADGNRVGRPAIQAFFGALAGRRATKGVFITTSRYSKEAREFARTASDSIVLINGRELADLLIEFEVGVGIKETFHVVDVDRDYFDDGA